MVCKLSAFKLANLVTAANERVARTKMELNKKKTPSAIYYENLWSHHQMLAKSFHHAVNLKIGWKAQHCEHLCWDREQKNLGEQNGGENFWVAEKNIYDTPERYNFLKFIICLYCELQVFSLFLRAKLFPINPFAQ